MIFDFRKNVRNIPVSNIHDAIIPIVNEYKYLGTTFSNRLDWDINTEIILKKHNNVYIFKKTKFLFC